MENTINALHELKNIRKKYDRPVESIDGILAEIPTVKVCTPIIGAFSSGKSALVNTVLGYNRRILKEDITPETAVPTEIVYMQDKENVRLYFADGKEKDMTLDDYRNKELDARSITKVKIFLRNTFLGRIPDVMIVDMPGFESGFESHNIAIDNYAHQSLAYIVAFPADDMIVRGSVGNKLRELVNFYGMPICVAITKYDKKTDEFEGTLEKLKENLKKYIGEHDLHFYKTSSKDGDCNEVKGFLEDIQKESKIILARKYKNPVLSELNATKNYLEARLKGKELNESELDEKVDEIRKQLSKLNEKQDELKNEFNHQIDETIAEIVADVEQALETEGNNFATIALRNRKVEGHMNTVVRNSVITSIKKRLIPKIEKYLKDVRSCLNEDGVGDFHITFDFDVN